MRIFLLLFLLAHKAALSQDKTDLLSSLDIIKSREELEVIDPSQLSGFKFDNVDHNQFLSLTLWMKGQKDERYSIRNVTESPLALGSEKIAQMISCIGKCKHYKKDYENFVFYNREIYELEDIETDENSYAWIYLIDGTLVRLGPKTSIGLKEINFGEKKNFIYLRLNQGLMTVLSREKNLFKEQTLQETDQIFLPLEMKQVKKAIATIRHGEIVKDHQRDDVESFLRPTNPTKLLYQLLNQKVKSNNEKLTFKPTELLLVTPTYTVTGVGLSGSFFSNISSDAFFKIYTKNELGHVKEDEEKSESVHVVLRNRGGEIKKQAFAGSWFKVSDKGRQIQQIPQVDRSLKFIDLLIRRPVSIYLAREFWLSVLSKDLLITDLDQSYFAQLGYRLWPADKSKSSFSLDDRINFLHKQTTKIETTLLTSGLNLEIEFKAEQELEKKRLKETAIDSIFYDKALMNYIDSLTKLKSSQTGL